MIYAFKPKPELVRAAGIAAGGVLIVALADPKLLDDPRGWAIVTAIGVAHAVVAALMGLYSTPTGRPGVVPVQPSATPVGAVQPPVGLPGEDGGVLVNPPAPTPRANFGAPDVRAGQSRPMPPQPPAPPAPTAAELERQRRRDSALKGWNTRRAEAVHPPQTTPDKPRARKRG